MAHDNLCLWMEGGQFSSILWNLVAAWQNTTNWDARPFYILRTAQGSNTPFCVPSVNKRRKLLIRDSCVCLFRPELGFKYHDLFPLCHTEEKQWGEFCSLASRQTSQNLSTLYKFSQKDCNFILTFNLTFLHFSFNEKQLNLLLLSAVVYSLLLAY